MLSNDTTFFNKKYHYFLVVPKMCLDCHNIFGFNFIGFQWQNYSIFNNSCTKSTWFVTNWLSCQSKLHLIGDKTKFHVKIWLEMKLQRWCNIDLQMKFVIYERWWEWCDFHGLEWWWWVGSFNQMEDWCPWLVVIQ